VGSLVASVDGSETGRDCGAATIGKEKTSGGDEVAVEALAEATDARDDDEGDGPARADGVFEREGSGEGLSE